MNSKTIRIAAFAGLASLALGACVTDPDTGQQRISKSAIGGIGGALGGYLLGDIVGGRRDRTEKIVGAGIGAVAGAGIGYYLDQQERELRQKTAGTGIDVVRDGDSLLLNMPSQVTFDVDSSAVKPEFRNTLNDVASTLVQYESTYIDVYGHTDSTGSDAYNQTLSERRAQSVSSYLTSRGVQSARLATRGFGESQPVASNTTEEGRAQNRRVEIRIVPVTQSDVNG
ncbi:outer membrane protein OmpA-like peptidoglycan-associated protein [Blastomonas natatoria]|uniref:Outer membrane protein OmpA-like peptidoglycan-associated protein n=1 Tax=Blastomonas natatoria TaxID=34015 RepID=A0A2V3UVQ8_9SPHN|nr:OmpA family protein [Blastomonas natatoria]PXW72971.1 outer membrane protein OmpA-like peptidoglycan-associated protein [Blastomonas natatoria]